MNKFVKEINDGFNSFAKANETDIQKSVELLKKVLKDNDFKQTQTGSFILLTEIGDQLSVEVSTFWQLIATQL